MTQKFYWYTPTGVQEITFDQAVSSAESDPAKQVALKESLIAALADPAMANYAYLDEQVEGGGICYDPNPVECPQNSMRAEGVSAAAKRRKALTTEIEPTDLEGITVIADRPVISNGPGGGFTWGDRSPGMVFLEEPGGFSNPEKSPEYQQCWANDYKKFVDAKQEACQDAFLANAENAGNLALMGGACYVAAGTAGGGGAAAIACGGAAVIYVVSIVRMVRAHNKCAATYPGPSSC